MTANVSCHFQSNAQGAGEKNRKSEKIFYCFRRNNLTQKPSRENAGFSTQTRKFALITEAA